MSKIHPLQNAALRDAVPRKSFILKSGIVLFFVMSLLLLQTAGISAQTVTTGQISGNVVDQSGAAVPDATVTITQVGTGETRTVMTSEDGNYSLPNLSIGTYRVTVTKSGFKE